MAVHKENLLSLGYLTGTERNTFTKQRQHSVKKSVSRPVLLQSDFSTLQSHQQLRAMELQQRWQELKQRELTAQQHNRQLLQQFEEAQNTLREMLTLNTAMKTIRMEYERYLEESAPRWQQQLKEKTQAAQKKRMEDYLKSCLKNTEVGATKSSADRPSLSQGPTTKPQKVAPPPQHYSQNRHIDYNQDGSPQLSYMSSWLTHPQSHSARFPLRPPYQPQGSSHVPPSFLPPPMYSYPLQLHHLASTPTHHHHSTWPRQNPPGRASLQPDYPWSWTAGVPSGSEALWGQLYTEEAPPEQELVQEAETSRAASSKRDRGGGSRSSHLSQELDIKPVRLSSGGPAESSESSRVSSQASREKRKERDKRGRSRRSSSDRETSGSQESSRTSSVIIAAAVTAAQSSESDASSEKGRTSSGRRSRRSAGLSVESPRAEELVKERSRSNGDDSGSPIEEDSQSTVEESRSEEAGDQSPDDKSESCREESGSQRDEESGSVSIKIENGGVDEIEKEERSSSEESSAGEKDEEEEEQEKDLGDGEEDGEEKEDSQRDEERDVEERDVEDDDEASERKNTTEEEETGAEEEVEEQESEEEKSDRLKKEDGEYVKQDSASSQDEELDEDESEGAEDKIEEDGESDDEEENAGWEEEEEQRGDEAGEPEEERDSDDSIILPPNKSKKMHIIPEEDSEDEGDEEEEEEQREEAEEERDSEDSIISPQNKHKKMHIIPEKASEDEDSEKVDEEEEKGSKTGSSDDDSNEFSDEDIEHLLAPQEQSQKKEEENLKTDEKPKEICDQVEIFVKSTKMDNESDSEEFDHFYD